jgi:hypothetical protein
MEKARVRIITWAIQRSLYQKIAKRVEPTAIIEIKSKWYWSILYCIGVILTFGLLIFGISHKKFMSEYATTLITRQGYPRIWKYLSIRVIVHECRHTTQAVFFGWLFFPIAWINRRFRAWLGLPLFALVYFVLPFPIYFAAGRFYLELDADKKAWRYCLKNEIKTADQILEHAKRRAKRLSSGIYFWSWPYPWACRSYMKAANNVIEECL